MNESKRAGVGLLLLGLMICGAAVIIAVTMSEGILAGIGAVGVCIVLAGFVMLELAQG